MRLINFNGVQHKISEGDWRNLLQRFDEARASRNVFGYFVIPSDSTCRYRHHKCLHCSLQMHSRGTNGCLYFYRKLIGEEAARYIHFYDSAIMWSPEFDEKVREALKKVGKILSDAQRV